MTLGAFGTLPYVSGLPGPSLPTRANVAPPNAYQPVLLR